MLLGGWMERWIDGWMEKWVDEWIDGRMDRWQDVWTDGLIDKLPLKGHLNSYSVPFGETDEYADSCTLP